MDAEERARRSAEAMWRGDGASAWFGMTLTHVAEGTATLELAVEAHHANGHGICHGGVVFALADSAFAFACNSRNVTTVAFQNAITYLAPARLGDRLSATARERSLAGRNGIYDATVTREDGTVIAEFRGHSRALGTQLFEE
ncbi:hydroxyphenylacetyl-CoA thioesterase PaaI [Ovoidimarina sediminis]|uniref:hydroxyphenylacetyl-CoA thioesterase PaaI n=1 Tax=Ovoidimarina sediminis TaxID=3079856 RepID=UPI00291477C1|nr:hydroxyphenylacetyl-CoA thioesterase PaaI [Rhodophyticola sp. MJ-SS7]MDU8945207.1 hydroxyphenylacetyl-CoA thioesterase PaaI [Rhodophyticola sp. MJ-SS7]